MLVTHGTFEVNGKKVDIASYSKTRRCYSSKRNKKRQWNYKNNIEENASRPVPEWLEKDAEKLSGKVVRLAAREDIDLPVEEHLIVELYSK